MAILFSCKCGHALRAQEDAAGKRSKCPNCGTFFTIPVAVTTAASPLFDWSPPELGSSSASTGSLATAYALEGDAPSSDELSAPGDMPADPGSQRYKVYVQNGKGFSGKFDPSKLEAHLNALAAQGWSVRAAATLTVSDNTGTHDDLVIILEH